jgi:signal transduction histidine kinase
MSRPLPPADRCAALESEIDKLSEEISDCYEEMALIYEVTDQLRPPIDVGRVAKVVLTALVEALRVRRAFLLLAQAGEPPSLTLFSAVTFEESVGPRLTPAGDGPGVAVSDGISGEVLATGSALIVNDVAADPRFRPYAFPIASLLALPLKGGPSRDGVFGVLNVADRRDGHGFTSGDLKLGATVAGLAGAALENALLVATLQRVSQELTEANHRILDQQGAMIRAEKLSSLGRMAAGVAHELRNPLAVISGRAEILRMATSGGRPPSADRVDSYLAIIHEQAHRAARIVSGLSAYARERPPEMTEVSLGKLLPETVELVHAQLKFEAVEVDVVVPPDLPLIRGNPDQLQQVFINLAINAVQAMKGGGRLTMTAQAGPEWLTVRVADTGIGIPPENLSKVFDPFFSTKPEGEGTGLGLSIIHAIVDSHGGRINVTSRVGIGTVFTLEFPIVRGESR